MTLSRGWNRLYAERSTTEVRTMMHKIQRRAQSPRRYAPSKTSLRMAVFSSSIWRSAAAPACFTLQPARGQLGVGE
eukprot:6196770-Pleurochrysis_carterae.AAC.3